MITEFEAKFLNINVDSLQKKLIQIGALQTNPKKLMRRKIFDLPFTTPHKQWVRVRDEGDKITITLKRILNTTKIDGMREVEFAVEKFDIACEFLTLCGLVPVSYQENYRENWNYNGAFLSIDTWPGLAPFLEIEGTDESTVRSVAQKLELDFNHSLFGPVDVVYEYILGIPADTFNTIGELTFESIAHVLAALKANSHAKSPSYQGL